MLKHGEGLSNVEMEKLVISTPLKFGIAKMMFWNMYPASNMASFWVSMLNFAVAFPSSFGCFHPQELRRHEAQMHQTQQLPGKHCKIGSMVTNIRFLGPCALQIYENLCISLIVGFPSSLIFVVQLMSLRDLWIVFCCRPFEE